MIEINPIAKQSAAVEKMAKNWPIISTLMGGTNAIREANKTYLPQWPNESNDNYNARLAAATLYPAFERTVDVLAAKPFSKALTLSDDMPERLIEWMDDADLQGRDLQSFCSDIFTKCVAYGISGILVEYPKADNVNTVADEKAAGLRPYLIEYLPWDVLGWRTERINGVEKLTQLRLKERVIEPSGDYGEEEIERIRVLTPGAWQLWQKDEKKENWIIIDEGVNTLKDIPFVAFYGQRTGFMTGEPPLIELAHQNVEYYQSSSDQRTILHVARVPILTIIGSDDAAITIGASSAVKLPIGADMKFVEHSGAAIEAGRQSLLDLEERMRATGAELLVIQPGKITATQVQSENEANRCALQRMTENFEDALNQCLQYMADWVGEETGGSIELFKDFGSASLSDASAQLLLNSATAGKISDETLRNEYKRRGILSADLDNNEEVERLEEQGPVLGTIGEEEAA